MVRREAGRGPLVCRRGLIAAGAVLGLAAVGARIWRVNAAAVPQPEVVRHAMGEWVDLAGAFVELGDLEQTEGYFVRVSSAEVLSPRSYVERYTVVPEALEMAIDHEGDLGIVETPSLVCLTVDIRNCGSNGQLCYAEMSLVPERKNEQFMADPVLFISSERQYAENGATAASAFFGVRPGTEHTVHMPYIHANRRDGEGNLYESPYLNPVVDTDFEMVLSFLPVRHTVDVTVL